MRDVGRSWHGDIGYSKRGISWTFIVASSKRFKSDGNQDKNLPHEYDNVVDDDNCDDDNCDNDNCDDDTNGEIENEDEDEDDDKNEDEADDKDGDEVDNKDKI